MDIETTIGVRIVSISCHDNILKLCGIGQYRMYIIKSRPVRSRSPSNPFKGRSNWEGNGIDIENVYVFRRLALAEIKHLEIFEFVECSEGDPNGRDIMPGKDEFNKLTLKAAGLS
jgi:hypothetical protein